MEQDGIGISLHLVALFVLHILGSLRNVFQKHLKNLTDSKFLTVMHVQIFKRSEIKAIIHPKYCFNNLA